MCTIYNARYTTQCTVYSARYIVQCTVYSERYIAHCTVYSELSITQYAAYSVRCLATIGHRTGLLPTLKPLNLNCFLLQEKFRWWDAVMAASLRKKKRDSCQWLVAYISLIKLPNIKSKQRSKQSMTTTIEHLWQKAIIDIIDCGSFDNKQISIKYPYKTNWTLDVWRQEIQATNGVLLLDLIAISKLSLKCHGTVTVSGL